MMAFSIRVCFCIRNTTHIRLGEVRCDQIFSKNLCIGNVSKSLLAEDLNRRAPTVNVTVFKLLVVVINDSNGTIEDRPKGIQGLCS
jgi:hypothetical protein